MSILCRLFGHKSNEHVYDGGEYMRIRTGAIDGIGREHATLFATCPRCVQEYRAGQIHLIQRWADAQAEPMGELGDEARLRIAAKRAADALPDCIKFFDRFCAENTNPYISRAAQAAFIAKRTLPGILGDLLAALSAQPVPPSK